MLKLEELFHIAGKTVLITGATGFFGRYMARCFLEVGARVVLLARKETLLRQIEEYAKEFGDGCATGYLADFYDRQSLKNILEQVARTHEVDVLVNNAYDMSEKTGFNTTDGTLENASHDMWQNAFESGIYWAVLTTQIIGGQMRARGSGSIINVSSMYGIVSPHPALYEGKKFFNPPTYTVQKAGIIAFTRYIASFWGKYGVRCNAIAPGAFSNTESEGSNSVSKNDPFLERLKQKTVLGRTGHPNDLRGALIYLATDASSYMTGQVLPIDGGWTIT